MTTRAPESACAPGAPSPATPVDATSAEAPPAPETHPFPISWSPRRWPRMLTIEMTPPPDLPATPGALLGALARMSASAVVVGALTATAAFLSQALVPTALGHVLDTGLRDGLSPGLLPGLAALVALGVVGALTSGLGEATGMASWTSAWKHAVRAPAHRIALRSRAVTREVASGDAVATVVGDADHIGALGYFAVTVLGALASVVVVGVLMVQTSVGLGLLVLCGLPVVLGLVGVLVKPLDARLSVQREAQGRLSTITTDAVAGLRVLRGIGGEDVYASRYAEASTRVRDAGIRVAATQASLAAVKAGAPMVFTAVVVGAGAQAALAGAITAGQLVTFYGYTVFLVGPLGVMTDLIQFATRAWVGARKIARIQGVEPLTGDTRLEPGARLVPDGDLEDSTTGVVLRGGRMTALVCAEPARAAALAERLGRLDDAAGPVCLGGTDLRAVSVDEVRSTIVVSGAHAEVFAGVLAEEVLGDEVPLAPPRPRDEVLRGGADLLGAEGPTAGSAVALSVGQRERVEASLSVAAADDVVDSLGGLAGVLSEKGRNLSGGQRQRLALARAVARRSPVLVLIEPTSALDSHTEDLVARRLHAERRGLTTVVVTASPLLLGRCEEVVLLEAGASGAGGSGLEDSGRGAPGEAGGSGGEEVLREVARGTHHELMDGCPAYRDVVARGGGAPGGAPASTADPVTAADRSAGDPVEAPPGPRPVTSAGTRASEPSGEPAHTAVVCGNEAPQALSRDGGVR